MTAAAEMTDAEIEAFLSGSSPAGTEKSFGSDKEIDDFLNVPSSASPNMIMAKTPEQNWSNIGANTLQEAAIKPELSGGKLFGARALSAASGASFGGADELAAAASAAMGRGSYSAELGKARGLLDQYHSERPLESMGLEFAGGLPTAMALPTTRSFAGAAAQGGGVGAAIGFNSGKTDFKTRAREAVNGAVLGAVAGGTARSLGATPESERLMAQGVRPTVGQAVGGMARRVERGATALPVVGDFIQSAQRRGIESFNRTAYNRVLAPLGEEYPARGPVGHQAIDTLGQRVSNAYNAILPRLHIRGDDELLNDITTTITNAGDELPPERLVQLGRIVDRTLGRFDRNDRMTGEQMKQVDTRLGTLGRGYMKSQDPDQRLLGEYITQVQTAIRENVVRANPTEGHALDAANHAYANYLRVLTAAGRQGSREGIFSPSGLNRAARSMDQSLRHGAFARGQAIMQDLASDGERVLGADVPDAGAPFRAFVGGGLGPLAAFFRPVETAVTVGGTMAAYSPLGQRLLTGATRARSGVPVAAMGAGLGLARTQEQQ